MDKLDPKRYRKVQKQVAQLNLTDEQKQAFKKYINTALLLAHLSDTFMARSEEILKDSGDWNLELKTLIKHATGKLMLVTKYTDETLNRDEAAFYSDLAFLDKLMLSVIEKVDNDEKQIKLLNILTYAIKRNHLSRRRSDRTLRVRAGRKRSTHLSKR